MLMNHNGGDLQCKSKLINKQWTIFQQFSKVKCWWCNNNNKFKMINYDNFNFNQYSKVHAKKISMGTKLQRIAQWSQDSDKFFVLSYNNKTWRHHWLIININSKIIISHLLRTNCTNNNKISINFSKYQLKYKVHKKCYPNNKVIKNSKLWC